MNVPLAPPPPPPPALPAKINPPGEDTCCYDVKPISLEEFRESLFHCCNVEGGGFTIKTNFLLDNYLQKGPVCGIVALATVGKLIGKNVTPDEFLRKAKENGFSKSGELFSVDDVASLAKKYSLNVTVHSTSPEEHLFDLVNQGAIVLIAYDADKNHSPCFKSGHKAHWAIVYGVATRNPELAEHTFTEAIIEKRGILYVIAGQGKSGKPALWKLSELLHSNENLTETDIVTDIQLRDKFLSFRKN